VHNVCLICSALLIVNFTFVITVFFLFLLCVSTILVNKDDHKSRGAFANSRILSLVERISIDMIYRCFGSVVYAIVGLRVCALAVSIFARRCHISDNLEVAVESGVGGT